MVLTERLLPFVLGFVELIRRESELLLPVLFTHGELRLLLRKLCALYLRLDIRNVFFGAGLCIRNRLRGLRLQLLSQPSVLRTLVLIADIGVFGCVLLRDR